jgi:hypothetical protein
MKESAMNRRTAIAVASTLTLAIPPAGRAAVEPADTADPVRFGRPQAESSTGLAAEALTHSAAVSADGRSVEVIFDQSMTFDIDKCGSSLTKTWTAALQFPRTLQKMPPAIAFMGVVRGFVKKDPKARIVVTLDLGGVNRVVDFPFGNQGNLQEDWDATVFSSLPMIQEKSTTPAGNTQISTKPLDLGYYPVAITVTIQRATTKVQAFLSVDSIDIETFTPKTTPSAKRQKAVRPAKTH